ncbi:Hypothetical Protein U712_18180 [Bacillus subtilis PY79]|nr:Hypothetical Protein U712_18180 [Bacillus subtilis PY79]AQZ92498.1 hypothetical protein B4U62_19510 [Bacillus subtilis]EME08349.1 hypothetical protein BS732_0567 [Bacillus subtilis MB73/2]RFP84462.1 hypothetical protein D0N41_02755 [Bacillus subtilis KCTC 1028 = ATCC 6051a]AYE66196.1 hypothetical protein D3Z87_19565 [Bacillus subtilis]
MKEADVVDLPLSALSLLFMFMFFIWSAMSDFVIWLLLFPPSDPLDQKLVLAAVPVVQNV